MEEPQGIPSEPGYFTALFGAPVDALHRCPEPIRAITDALSSRCRARPEAVVATALATAAAAMGPGIRVGGRNQPLSLNVVVSHSAARSLPWFDLLLAPFLGRVLKMQANLGQKGQEEIERIIKIRTADLKAARRTVAPNGDLISRLEAEVQRGPSELKPLMAASRLNPKEIGDLLVQSFDGGQLLVGAGADPGEELLRMKLSDRTVLAELLNRSWTGIPLSFGKRSFPAVTSLLWQTVRSGADLNGVTGFGPAIPAPPVLYLRGDGTSRQIPELPEEAEWNHIIGFLFDHRCLNRECHYKFTAEAQSALDQFADEFDVALPEMPPGLLPHVVWLPELCERIAPILWILNGKDNPIEPAGVDAAVALVRWLGRQHLCGLTPPAIAPDTAADTDNEDAAAEMLHKIRVRGPLTRRELRRSYDNPQAEWFYPLLNGLLEAGKARYIDRSRLVATDCSLPGGGGSAGSEDSGNATSEEGKEAADKTVTPPNINPPRDAQITSTAVTASDCDQPQRTLMNGKPVFFLDRKTILRLDSKFKDKLLCDGPTFSAGDACAYTCSFCYVKSVFCREPGVQNVLKTACVPFHNLVFRREKPVQVLKRQLLNARGEPKYVGPEHTGKVVYASPLVDVAANLELTKETVELVRLLLEFTGWHVRLLSKSSFLPRIAEALGDCHDAPRRVIYGVSTGTLDDKLAAAFECGTAKVSKRLESLHRLQDAGFRTFGMICPSLPQTDYDAFAREMAAAIRAERCEHVWAEVINLRGESFTRTAQALNAAGFWDEVVRLAEVSGPGHGEAWQEYARRTFEAHTRNIPVNKLRFLQYPTQKTLPWWTTQVRRGAVLLGKAAESQMEETGTLA